MKISSVSNLSDARYCAGMGVNQLGFCFDASNSSAVSPELFVEIKNWVAGVQFVGEFEGLSTDEVAQIQQNLPLDYIEITNLELVESVGVLGKPLIFKLELTTDGDVEKLPPTLSYLDELVEYMVIDSKNPDLFESINKSVSFYHGRVKLIRAFDVSIESVNSINGFIGIQLMGTEEEQPGLKDYDEVMDILEVLEVS